MKKSPSTMVRKRTSNPGISEGFYTSNVQSTVIGWYQGVSVQTPYMCVISGTKMLAV